MNERGFTLVETIVAVSVIGILSAVAMPMLALGMRTARLDYEAARMATELRYLREMTMNYMPVHSDFEGITVSGATPFMRIKSNGYAINKGTVDIEGHKRELPDFMSCGFVSTVTRAEIKFEHDGTVKPPATVKMTGGDETRYIIVDSVGRVRVSKTPPQ